MDKHKEKVEEMEKDLKEHLQNPPEKGAKARICTDYIEKESYLEFEVLLSCLQLLVIEKCRGSQTWVLLPGIDSNCVNIYVSFITLKLFEPD